MQVIEKVKVVPEGYIGKGNFDDMIFESAIDFWFDDVDFGEDKLWKYFNELK